MKNTLTTDEPSITEILDYFLHRCLVNPAHLAIVVHEIVPKSQDPKNWRRFENRVALCHECHDKIHNEGTAKWIPILTKFRKDWANRYAW